MSEVRCFVGIPLDEQAVNWVARAHALLVDRAPGWSDEKWVTPSNLHVTVRFLGSIPSDQLPELESRIAVAADGLCSFDLALSAVVARPSSRRCRMLWAACEDASGGFADLAAAVRRGSEGTGPEGDGRVQVPHVTLCRARRVRAMSDEVIMQVNGVLDGSRPTMSVPSFSLFTSRLAPRGPEYQQIATWRLRGE